MLNTEPSEPLSDSPSVPPLLPQPEAGKHAKLGLLAHSRSG
jgi:hypothetical protein